jgi:thymidylate synthase
MFYAVRAGFLCTHRGRYATHGSTTIDEADADILYEVCHNMCMRVIRAPHLARAHELVVKMVLEKGHIIETEDREATVECEGLAVTVTNPLADPMVSPASRFGRRFMEQYATDLLQGSDSIFEYDYHGRLFDWGERLSSAGAEVHVDQVAYVVKKLRESPVSRRALAITWNPVVDESLDECPCLQLVQCMVRENKLQMNVVFRSNDMLTAAGANMFALAKLQEAIASQLGLTCGPYTHISLIPHIYHLRDINDIEPFCGKGQEIRPIGEVCRICGKCVR